MTVFASSAGAQPAPVPVRVIQGSDGTLYVVQGSNSWTLVPDQATDSDVAALNPSGEIDGSFPNQLFVVQAPAVPPAAAPAPAPPAAAPAPPAGPAPVTGDANLSGKVASEQPGTLIAVGATISSVVDAQSKPHDFYAIALSAGSSYQFTLSPTKSGGGINMLVLNPDGSASKSCSLNSVDGVPNPNPCLFTPAVNNTFSIRFDPLYSGSVAYKFTVKPS
jgi:hypothetical protein